MENTNDTITALAASLVAIDEKFLKSEKGQRQLWFQGKEWYFDLFFTLQNEELIWFQATFRGKALSWKKGASLQTGETGEGSGEESSEHPSSRTIRSAKSVDSEFVHLICEILKRRTDQPLFQKAVQVLS